MKSNYKQLGDYIVEVNNFNTGIKFIKLIGVSMEKTFIPSVANINGVDLSIYKIINKDQLACKLMSVGRDEKLPVDLYKDEDPAIVSPAYYVFESKDKEKLIPEYLMMWLCRPENDRYIGFISGGDVRGGISWDDFCDIPINVPSINNQKDIVKEYKLIQDRISLNEKLIRKLEETAQAIYKQWFIDFEFPDENGGSYRSNGGRMVESECGEIPLECIIGKLANISTITMGQSPEGESYNKEKKGIIFYQGRTDFGYRFPEVSSYTTEPKKKALKNDILVSVRAPVGDLNIATNDCCIGRGLASLRSKYNCNSHLFYLLKTLKPEFDISDDEGTIFGSITKDDLSNLQIVYSKNLILNFEQLVKPIDEKIYILSKQNAIALRLKSLLLSKLSSIDERINEIH